MRDRVWNNRDSKERKQREGESTKNRYSVHWGMKHEAQPGQ